MAARSDAADITKKQGKRVFETILYPEILPADDDIYIITTDGDRLDLLAQRFYNDKTLWWVIAQANHVGKGTMQLDPGIQIRIPQNTGQIFDNLNTLQRSR